MTKRIFQNLFSLAIMAALLLTGCGTQSQPAVSSTYSPMRVSAESCDYGGEFKTIEAVDAYTVRFTLCSADAAFPAKLASPVLAIQDKDFLDAHHGNSESMTTTINGTGPYRVLLNIPNSKFELQASKTYWGIPPTSQFINLSFLPNASFAPALSDLNGIDATGAYFLLNHSNNIYPGANEGFNQVKLPPMKLFYLGFNDKIKPLDDINVRQAIAMLIDRTYLTQQFLGLGAEPAGQMIPDGVTGNSTALNWYDLSAKNAHDLLVKAGFDFNQVLTLAYFYNPLNEGSSNYYSANAIKNELEAAQVKVSLKGMGQDAFDKDIADGNEMMFLNDFSALYPDGAAFYHLPLVQQASLFGNPYTQLLSDLENVQSTTDSSERQVQFDVLNQAFKDQVPLVPIGFIPQWSFVSINDSGAATNGFYDDFETISNQKETLNVLMKDRSTFLWPADETDPDTFQLTRLLYDTLVTYGFGNEATLQPSLADSWTGSEDAKVWTFKLRYNVQFSNGAKLDANDVVASFAAIWDVNDSNHMGHTGDFTIFKELFGPLLNAK